MIRIVMLLLLTTLALSAREPKQIKLARQGTISGMYITRFRTKRIAAYLGIPYAQPPVDFRRFRTPEIDDLPNWEGVRNATLYAPDCLQIDPNETMSDTFQDMGPKAPPLHDQLFMKLLDTQLEEKPRRREYSEDCLYLNVYVPDGCDTVSCFNRKGKKSAFEAWKAFTAVTEGFMLDIEGRAEEAMAIVEKYVIILQDSWAVL